MNAVCSWNIVSRSYRNDRHGSRPLAVEWRRRFACQASITASPQKARYRLHRARARAVAGALGASRARSWAGRELRGGGRGARARRAAPRVVASIDSPYGSTGSRRCSSGSGPAPARPADSSSSVDAPSLCVSGRCL
ncbi:hypothetical protein EVAR_16086_1 [Eumeta japonica]|uniref:Uncharacterized protein n=1 Tax=Eumeta variegata TaxID=151549 RepID=A0A4C1UK13_EUMVA|nr:hypothetical protein EVAR_16086_1 [Eumeta japonica]